MQTALIVLLNGISYGLLLFMLSSGLTLILGMMGVLNFAHASFYMLGAYFAYEVSRHVGFWPGLIVAPILVGGIGALIERYGLRHIHRYGHAAELLFTFGLAYMIEEVVHLVWGAAAVDYPIPASMNGIAFSVAGFGYSSYRLFMMGVSVAMLIALHYGLTRTRVGLVIQAAITHPDMTEALGHNVPRTMMIVFSGGAALAGLAGVIGGNAFVTEPGMAASVGSIIFVVVIVGGMGSLKGAFVASLLVGLLQTAATTSKASFQGLMHFLGLAPLSNGILSDFARITLAQFAPLVPYVLLIAILVIRPQGMFGKRDVS
jgi:branched-chain amino acid transport system permease protein